MKKTQDEQDGLLFTIGWLGEEFTETRTFEKDRKEGEKKGKGR